VMEVKKGDTAIVLPDIFELQSLRVKGSEYFTALQIIRPEQIVQLRKKTPGVRGIPAYAALNSNRVELFPAVDADAEIVVRYTTLHEQ